MRSLKILIVLILINISMQAQKTNVVFIIVDDLKPLINSWGEKEIKTPNLDSFVKESVAFTNAQAQQAVCAPSRVSFMTGMRPDYTQILDLKTHMRDKVPNSLTMPEYFKQNGYITAGLGKVLHGAKNDDPQSWSIPFIHDDQLPYSKLTGPPADFQYQNKSTHRMYNELLKQKKQGEKFNIRRKLNELGARPAVESEDVPDDALPDGAIAKRSIELLKDFQNKKQPFFLTIGFKKPHLPFVAPKKYWDLYKREDIKLAPYQKHAVGAPGYAYHKFGELKNYSDIKMNLDSQGRVIPKKQKELIHGYYAAVSYVDAQIGKVLKYLKDSGLEKNTIIVLIGDHGWHLGDHGLWCKQTNYEQATRTPLIIKAPGMKTNVINTHPAELIDIFPTLCEFTGLKTPEKLQGISLIPILNGSVKKVQDVALSQYPRNGKMGYSLRNDRYRYIEWHNGDYKKSKDYIKGKIDAVEFYDYKKDPLETKNLAQDPAYAEIIKKMKKELDCIIR
ncbi:MAG: sulfatase [Flavobacteriia bacterium]|nr:MAG: sulfatase [Flavobacteriia bacterium]